MDLRVNEMYTPSYNADKNQSADNTAWTGFWLVFNYYSCYCVDVYQLLTSTFY